MATNGEMLGVKPDEFQWVDEENTPMEAKRCP
jgi:hypothetical protein